MYTVIQDTHKHKHTQGEHKHRHTHTQGTHKTYIYRAAFNIIMNSFVYSPHLSRRCLLQPPSLPSPPQPCRSKQHHVCSWLDFGSTSHRQLQKPPPSFPVALQTPWTHIWQQLLPTRTTFTGKEYNICIYVRAFVWWNACMNVDALSAQQWTRLLSNKKKKTVVRIYISHI